MLTARLPLMTAIALAARLSTAAPNWLDPVGTDTLGMVQVGDLTRTWVLHTPPGYDGKTPLPLIMVLHGGGMNAGSMEFYCELNAIADRESFLLVYPNAGVGPAENPVKRAGWSAHMNATNDDLVFIKTLMTNLTATLAIDTNHTMIAGLSSGALMSHRVAYEMGTLFTTMGSVAGSFTWRKPTGPTPPLRAPTAAISVIAIHGMLDQSVPYDGTDNDRILLWPARKSAAFWASADGCLPQPTLEYRNDIAVLAWTNAADAREVRLYSYPTNGHVWPGESNHPSPVPASEELWSFLIRDRGCRLSITRGETGTPVTLTMKRTDRIPAQAVIRYTTDRQPPSPVSLVLGATTLFTNSVFIRAQAFAAETPIAAESDIQVRPLTPRPADEPATTVAGLHFDYYEGVWDQVPAVSGIQPVASGIAARPDLRIRHAATNFAVIFSGYVRILKTGTYTFTTRSDDGSTFDIGGVRVVDNDGLHPPGDRSHQAVLSAGLQPITIGYLQQGGDAELAVSIAGPGFQSRPVEPEDFRSLPAAPPSR